MSSKNKPLQGGMPPLYVNLRGEPLILDQVQRAAPPFVPARDAPTPQALVRTLDDAELQTLHDALVLAGCARGISFIMAFLRLLERKTTRGTLFNHAELHRGLSQLIRQERVVSRERQGFDVPRAQRDQALPGLLAAPDSALAWRAWAHAARGHGGMGGDVPMPYLQDDEERVAFARLALFAGMSLTEWQHAVMRQLGSAATVEVLAQALVTPFMPELLDRMHSGLRDTLLVQVASAYDTGAPLWKHLDPWIDSRLTGAAAVGVPVPLRLKAAERRLHRGDLPGSLAAVQGLAGAPALALLAAGRLAWQGRFAEAAPAFNQALKDAGKATGARRGLAPYGLAQWYLLSLMAADDPLSWTTAVRFAIGESGSRTPAANGGWGQWAHVLKVRLGDAELQPVALTWRDAGGNPWGHDRNANTLILAAWLGQEPLRWHAESVRDTVRALHELGWHWKADLVRQACERLDLPVPDRAGGTAGGLPEVWPVRYFGAAREVWRDALAAISALGGSAPRASAATNPVTLQWQLELDGDGRVVALTAFERTAGARGPGKPKTVSLARLKKSTVLDARDAAVARNIESSAWSRNDLWLNAAGAVMALVGHPAVVFADAPLQPVDLREGLPMLEVQRQRASDGSEAFVFHLADTLLSGDDPELDDVDPDREHAEIERRNALRIFRDSADRARLVRVSPAQRRVAELVRKRWAVPVQAKAELDTALRVLAGHFQLHSDAAAGQEVPGDNRLRAQLSPQGDALHLRLVVQPFGSFGPQIAPGLGRARVITLHEGLSLATQRDLKVELAHLAQVQEALPFLHDDADCSWLLEDPEQALTALERLAALPAVAALDWPRGKPVRVITLGHAAVQIGVSSGVDWLALDGKVQVDEERVLSLQRLMQLADASGRGRFVALGQGEYLALTEQLRRQLADLQALAETDKQGLRLPVAAAAWLAETLDGQPLTGDRGWTDRLRRFDEAAALQPALPATLQAELRGYQAEGFVWLARLAHAGLGACLADDMGLGKTVQTLALLLHRAALGPALVIAPTSVCANWAAEAMRFAPTLRVVVYGEGERAQALQDAGPGDLLVASYALAQREIDAFAAREWATLVLDEAQALKNAATKRARSIGGLRAGFRLALSGTPVENRLADLWSLMNILNPGLLGSQTRFNERFAAAIEREHDDAARQRLRRLISPFLLRRTKVQVLTDLPPRTEIVHRVEPGPEERVFLEALRRRAIERVAEATAGAGAGPAAFHMLAELMRLRRAACDPRLAAPDCGIVGAKVHEFGQLAGELVEGRHKALVFSQFTDFLKLLAERLDSAGLAYQYLDGSTPAADRARRVAAFQRGEGELFLISLKAGGFGLNLTAADYVIIVDPWWNPAAEDQAMGRAHRIGQQRPVTVYRLVTAGSIEERIVALHHDKRSLADGILEGQDQAQALRADDLRELLRDV
ncbi:MAG: DEAD/DEAH box helicase [Rubrivivax sp.]|nr:DEAD/DEAH box helicase [Rubrivivax sp.]